MRGLVIPVRESIKELPNCSLKRKINRPPAARLGGFLFQDFLRKINIHDKENTCNDIHI
jgi:hypothetical protein